MSNNMEWICSLLLSNHMWDDEFTPPRYYNMPPRYNPENINEVSYWEEIIRFLSEKKFTAVTIEVGDGVIWDTHPEIAAPNAWSKNLFGDILDKFRAAGIKPWPLVNFSTCHDTWIKDYRFRVGTPEYDKFVADMLDEASELFDTPEQFHIGMDEENYEMQVFRGFARIRHKVLYWKFVHELIERCEKNGSRVAMYGDHCWDHPDDFVANVPKSVLISNWYYNHFKDWPVGDYNYKGQHAYELLEKHGYDQLPTCSTWLTNENPMETVANLKKTIAPERLTGFQCALWARMCWDQEHYLKNDIQQLYLARRNYYPETLEKEERKG